MKWYAIYTKPRNEKKVAELLGRDGIQHYLPLFRREKKWSDRKKMVDEPLFSSYVFVYIEEKEHLPVLRTPGVVRFVMFEGKKVPLPEIQIEAIRKFCETGEELLLNEQEYTVGKKVRVIRGDLKGLEGRLVQILGKQRVKVEIDAIRHTIFVRIPMGSLEITGEAEKEEEGGFW